ncbi:MAG: endonuclease/exonuclease/phosphatase family protein [Ilumatobacter sp.]
MSLRVATWNLWWHFGPWEARQPLVIDTLREIDADIICLQEVWSDENDDQLDHIADALEMYAVRTDPVFWNGPSFGNAVMSRSPLERICDERLPNAAGEPSHRRVVAARVDTPDGVWPVASTHLDHRFDRSADRVAQMRRLMELAVGWRGDPATDLPAIIGADVNALADTDEVRMATGRTAGVDGIVFSDAWEQAGDRGADHGGATWLRDNPYSRISAWPNRRLDYLFVSWPRPKPVGNPIRCWLAGHGGDADVWASDHLAVVGDFVTPDD